MNKQEIEKWISVDDRLPINKSYVLAFKSKKGFSPTSQCVAEYTDKYGFSLSCVTHWMPLPNPPKASEE